MNDTAALSKITQQHDGFSHLFPSICLYLLSMTETPEWFQLQDEPEQEPKKRRRITLKIALFTLPLLLIGGVMVFGENGAEGEDQPNLPTLSSAAPSSSAKAATTIIKKTSNPKVNKVITPKNSNKSNASNVSSGLNGNNSGIKNPGLPSKNDPDHGAGLDRHKRPGEHHEDHEGGQPNIGSGEND